MSTYTVAAHTHVLNFSSPDLGYTVKMLPWHADLVAQLMDRVGFSSKFGLWSGGASGEMQGMRWVPSAASLKGQPDPPPLQLPFQKGTYPCPTCQPMGIHHGIASTPAHLWVGTKLNPWVMGPRESGGLFSCRGIGVWFSCPHVGVSCQLTCPRVLEMP